MATEAELILEDGTGIVDANTYALFVTADAYHSLRGNVAWADADDVDKATALVNATLYTDLRWSYVGSISVEDTGAGDPQALDWPRNNFDFDLFDSDGIDVTDTVPQQIIDGMLEYALRALEGPLLPDPTVPDDAGRFVKLTREKLGPLEEEIRYSDSRGTRTTRRYPVPDTIIRQSGLVENVTTDRATRK